jgi:hypothetical protein
LLCDECYANHKGLPCKPDRETKAHRELVG